jgi:CheY-like chemotaxis protein
MHWFSAARAGIERKPMGHADKVSASPGQISGIRAAVQRVLVVDDDPDGAETVAEMLAVLGFQARFALDGLSAIQLAKVFEPQLILIDLSLPDVDGYEVARQIRREPGLSAAVLVALTGWSGPEREREARKAGFDHYLVKPVQLAALKPVLGV